MLPHLGAEYRKTEWAHPELRKVIKERNKGSISLGTLIFSCKVGGNEKCLIVGGGGCIPSFSALYKAEEAISVTLRIYNFLV